MYRGKKKIFKKVLTSQLPHGIMFLEREVRDMTYYVMSDMGIEEEFDSFEEADNYIDMNGDPSMLWIETDEDDFEPSYNEDEGFDPYMGGYSWDC